MNLASRKSISLPHDFTIPTVPAVVQRFGKLLRDPDVGVREIADVVAEDAPLAAKVLKIANSAYYGMREPCISTQHAAAVLGLRTLRNVIMQASVIRQYDHLRNIGFEIESLWRTSSATAQGCHYLARRSVRTLPLDADELYMCGLLLDIGQIVLLDNLKDRYVEIVREALARDTPVQIVESEHLGFDHTDVGQKIAVAWGLPLPVMASIQFHHGPQETIERAIMLGLVARTNALVHSIHGGRTQHAADIFDDRALAQLGITPDDVAALIARVTESLRTVEV
jgi:HD-like signal output (HDOD) protein